MKLKTATLLVLCTGTMGFFSTICSFVLNIAIQKDYKAIPEYILDINFYTSYLITLVGNITLVIFFYILYKNQKRDVKGE